MLRFALGRGFVGRRCLRKRVEDFDNLHGEAMGWNFGILLSLPFLEFTLRRFGTLGVSFGRNTRLRNGGAMGETSQMN